MLLFGNLSVEQYLLLASVLIILASVLATLAGIFLLRRAPRQPFFLVRQQTAAAGWRLLVAALGLLILSGAVRAFGAPVVFRVISPTPSLTFTPSITLTPTITFTPSLTRPPTITLTPSKTWTFSPSPTPFLPDYIQQQFTSTVPPDSNLRVMRLTFARSYTSDRLPINPDTRFANPIQRIYALYSYEHVNRGVQWTTVWYRDGTIIDFQSNPWNDDSEAGNAVATLSVYPGFLDYGTYDLEIFAGTEWKAGGRFYITGASPQATSTVTPSVTHWPSETAIPIKTPLPTK
jgi:type VI secretion system secreted protein VgrG